MSDAPVIRSELPLTLLHRGKVRDVYEVDEHHLLMVASDRVSAFDVVMTEPIPRKGEVLTQITAWWLDRLGRELGIRHHLVAVRADDIVSRYPALTASQAEWQDRAMLVHRTTPVLVECVIRGYIAGSAWKEYRTAGTLAGERLQEGLEESQRLDPPIFSPATKAQEGHDENITFTQVVELLGEDLADDLRRHSLEVYGFGRDTASAANIILADTKFEFGHDRNGDLLLIDEVLTPDSSRFWPKESYQVGRGQPSLDKQPIRDWLERQDGWDKTPPAPTLSDEVIAAASARYMDAFQRLTGISLDDWTPPTFESQAP